MWSIYTGKNVCEQFPTRELWDRLAEILQFNIPYASIAQTFNPQMGYTDVWDDIDFREDDRVHPTQKPVRLIERLVKASTNPNDIILDPFIGSGTTAIACLREHRHFIGFELNKEYYNKACERIGNEQAQLTLQL
jgi:DNA modification methylase